MTEHKDSRVRMTRRQFIISSGLAVFAAANGGMSIYESRQADYIAGDIGRLDARYSPETLTPELRETYHINRYDMIQDWSSHYSAAIAHIFFGAFAAIIEAGWSSSLESGSKIK